MGPRTKREFGGSEAWAARRSRHRDEAIKGSASWAEFEEGIRKEHSVKEGKYAPDVVDVVRVLDWDGEIEELGQVGVGGGWEDADMRSELAFLSLEHLLLGHLFPCRRRNCF